ncbi:MAG: ABC transporter permease, partial [candidate division Zixibacteria bacterium]|nr:ABC transporter permease [candidate division Zixibacteria bacterium]
MLSNFCLPKADPRISVELKREDKYYADQTHAASIFINSIGAALSIIFSLGAVIGAMITMYAAAANRTTEIAAMRALGFKRRNILAAFLIESILISFAGGIMGLIAASFLQLVSVPLLNEAINQTLYTSVRRGVRPQTVDKAH